MSGIRTFIALHLPPEIAAALAEKSAELGQGIRMVKWVEEKNIHLTLAFLGEIAPEMIAPVGEALEGAAATVEPYRMKVEGLGAFPSTRRPRVVWAGVTEGREETIALARSVSEALRPLGFLPEKRRFSPHITLGRVRGAGATPPLLCRRLEAIDFSASSFALERVHLMKSRLTPGGPIYDALKIARLGGADVPRREGPRVV